MIARARFARSLHRLTALRVRSRQAGKLQAELEHQLMKILAAAGGLRAVERLLDGLEVRAGHLALVEEQPSRRAWHQELADGRRQLKISVAKNRIYRSTHVQYERVRKIRLTPRQQRIHALQEAFYARYMVVGQTVYRDRTSRPAPSDRLLLLIGELEADVNNGGTAGMLEKAMAPGTTEAQLSALDERFYRVPEDLAVLAARHVGLKPKSS